MFQPTLSEKKSGRQFAVYSFTLEDVSKVTGLTIETLRKKMSLGQFNLTDAWEFTKFILYYALMNKEIGLKERTEQAEQINDEFAGYQTWPDTKL